jgi:hypothetical protein
MLEGHRGCVYGTGSMGEWRFDFGVAGCTNQIEGTHG